MLEAVIVALITGVLGWGIWKTRDWKPQTPRTESPSDLESTKFMSELLRESGKHGVRLDRFESELKNIRSEWSNYRSSVDSIVRRGIRHKVLESETETEDTSRAPVEEAPAITRSDLLRIGRGGRNNA